MALFNKDAKTKSLQDRLAERIQNSVQSSQAPYAPVTDKKDAAVANVTNTLKKTSTDPAAFTAALQGKVNPAKKGIDTKSVDSQTTQQAVTQEAGAQPTNRADNSYLDSYYSKRDETAGRTGTTVTPGSVKIDQSVFNDKSADSTVKNTLLSYYSKRQFENTPIEAAPMSTVKPTRVDNTIIGTAKTYGGALGGGLTAINKFAADRLNDTSDNVKGVGITDYAVDYYKDKDDEWLRKNLNPATYKAVTNAMRTNADMRKQALDQRNATDALQLAGQENLRQAKEGTNKIGETAVNVSSNVMEMSADRAITAALTAVGVPAKISQYTPLYLRSLGASNLEARQDGATENQAFVYGNLAASLEVATETMLSPTNFAEAAYGKGWLGSGIGKSALSTFSRKVAKSPIGQSLIYAVGNLGLAGIEESGEEAVSGVLTPLIKRITYDKDAKLDPKEVGESMLTAFIATVLTGGAGVANTSKAASVYNNPTTVNSLIEIAKTTQDEKTKAAKLATNLEKVVQDGGKPNNLEVVDLIHYLNESGSEAQTNKLYELADVDKSDSNAKAQLNGAVSLAMMNVNTAMTDASNMSESSMSSIDNEVNILANALVSEDVSDVLKPSIAYTLQSFNTTRTTANESGPVGIRRGDTVSYHVSQGVNETAPAGIEGYDVVRKHDNGTVDYIWTDDFNGNAFPEITRQVTVDARGKQTDTTPKTATIINDKSTLVPQNYTGFNVEEQRANENYWKEGRKRTGLSYNTTQMNNKAYFNNYWQMLQNAEANIANAQGQEVNVNEGVEAGAESSNPDQGRVDVVPTVEPSGRVREETRADVGINFINGIKQRFGANGETAERLNRVEKIYNSLAKNNVKPVDAGQFAGEIGGVAGTYVVPVKGTSARSLSSLTKKLKAAGFEKIKYFAGDLIVADGNGNIFPVNGAFDGSTVYVCVDNLYLTAEQIADHETFHKIIKDMGEGFFNSVEAQMRQRDSAAVDTLLARYREKYDSPAMTDRDLMEEIVCDAYGGMNIFQEGSGAEQFSDIVRAQGEVAIKGEETETPQGVENTEVAEIPETEQGEQTAPEITTEDVNAEAPTAETTEESVNTEPIRIKRSRDAEWEDVSREDAIAYGRELYGNLGNVKDPSRRLQMVNNSIQGYALTAEDVGGIESVDRDAKGAKVDAQTNAAIEKAAASDANQEIWDEPNAKLIFSGKAKSPDAYKFEVVEEKPNGTVTHTFFDTEDKATAHAEGRNQKNKTGAAIVVNLDESGALDRAVDESSKANMEAFEEDERRAQKYSMYQNKNGSKGGIPNASKTLVETSKTSADITSTEGVSQAKNDVKFSRSFDSNGRNLTEDQAEYFKGSKIRDAEGNLFALYHGTPNNFTVFDVSRSGENYDGWSQLGKGIYLAPDEKTAQHYADNAGRGRLTKVMPLYANLVNPFNVMNHVDFSIDDMAGKYGLNDYNVQFISKYGYRFIDFLSEHDEPIMDYLKSKGFDGIWDSYNGKNPSQVVAFEPNQVKNIDNTNPTENADIRFSRSFDAAGRILSEEQETYFKDSRVRDDNGNLMPVYHGTDADFNIFDTSVSGGKNGTAEGFGIYLTNDEEVSKHYGGRVIEGYANITRPATSWQKTIKQPELAKLIQKTCEMEADKMAANDGYDDRAQALRDTWISNYVYTPEYSTINGAYNAVAREILKANDNDMDIIQEVIVGQGIRDYESAMQFYNEALTPTTGIDGFWTKWSDAEGNETADVMLAFSSNQVKNLDNLTPTTNPDIRFSRAMDSNLRTLSDEQAEFFKDSKVRDRFGNLLALRHGTASDFTVFDPSRSGNNYNGFSEFGPGIYLTPDVGMAKFYADKATKISNGESKIMDLYANITNPFDVIKPIEFSIDDIAEKYNLHDYDVAEMTRWGDKLLKFLIDKGEDTRAYLSGKGYDGIIVSWYENTPSQVIAFNPNQVKNIDNLTPTTNEDIRFSRKLAEDGTQLEIADFLMQTQNMDEDVANKNATQISSLGNIVVKDSTFGEKTIGKTLAVGFKEDLIKDGRTSLIGKTVESADDLATIAQVFRNPRFETFRMFFVNDNGEVVYQTGVASGLVSQTSVLGANPYSFLTKLARDAKRAGAVAYYGLHNHPSGNPEPSSEDYRAGSMLSTFFNERNITRKGDVIINSNKYAVYDSVNWTVDIKPLNENIKDELLTPVGDTGLIRTISGPDDLANLGKAIQLSPGFSGVIYLNAKMKTTAVQEISNKFLSDEVKLSEFIEENLTKYGALNAAFVTDDRATFEAIRKIWKSGLGVDVILLENGQLAISANTVDKQNSGMLQKHSELEVDEKSVFDNSVLRFSRNFASTEEMNRAYSDAVKSNPEEAQKMLDAFAEEKGYTPYALYHGTDKYGFTEFDLGAMDDGQSIFMTDELDVAKSYSNSEFVGTPKPVDFEDINSLLNAYLERNTEDTGRVLMPDDIEAEYEQEINRAHKTIEKNRKEFERDAAKNGWADDYPETMASLRASYEKGLAANTAEELDAARDEFMNAFGDFMPEYYDISDSLHYLGRMDEAKESNTPMVYIDYGGHGYGEFMSLEDLALMLDMDNGLIGSGNLKLYAKTDNPLIVDANLSNWNMIEFDPLGVNSKMNDLQTIAWKKHGLVIPSMQVESLYQNGEVSDEIQEAMQDESIRKLVDEISDISSKYLKSRINPFDSNTRTRDVSLYAKQNGYDSVIFKNIYDIGQYGMLSTHKASTVYILFNPSQAKSADLTVYGDDGKPVPLSKRFDANQTDIRFSRNFETPTTITARAENEYTKNMVSNFNSSTESRNRIASLNPAEVAHTISTHYNSSINNVELKSAVDQLKQYANEKISTGQDVNYADARIIASTIARQVVAQNKALTDTDGYKTYAKMLKIVDEMPVKIPGNISRYIENYQGWKTANIDNIRIEQNGVPVKAVYDRLNKTFGDELFPTNLKQYEMAERIAEVVGNYRNIYENPYNDNLDLATQFATNDILNMVFKSPNTIDIGDVDLTKVYDTINDRRAKMLEKIGQAYSKGEDIDVTTTEEFRKAQTIETETDDGVDYRHANLNPEEWKTTKTKGNKAKRVLSPTDIIAKMEHDFGHNITEGQIRKKDVLGTFNRNNKGIRIKFSNDLPTACHELGHALDLKYNIQSKLTESMKNELLTRHRKGVQALIASYPESKRLGEAIAEYNREFLQNRDNVLNRFPEFSNFYLNAMSEDDRANMFALADNINAYYVASAKTAQQSVRLRSEGQPDYRTFGEKLKDKCKHLYQMFVDSNAAINDFSKATGSNAYILATNAAYADARAGQIIVGALFDKDGTMVSEGLTAALNEINLNDDVEYKAFGEYLIVKHGPEFMETTGGDVFSHPTENTAEWMNKRAAELEEKYPAFKESAEKLYNFQNQFLYTWGVETGLISEEVYNEWTERWKYYVPFNRVIVRDSRNGFVVGDQSRRGFANQTSGIHKAKGSTRDIYHPVDNIMMNIIRMVKAGMSNQVMVEIADAAVKNNVDANIMEKIPAPMVGKNFYTEALKKKLATQFEDANAMGQIADESLDAIEDIIDGIDAVITQYSVGKAVGDKVTLLRDGKEEFWKINDPFLLESLTKMQPNRAGGLLEAYAVMSRFMTSNITGNNIIWSLSRNAPKDLGTLYTYSPTKSPIKIFGGIAKAYSNNIKNAVGVEVDPYYMEYLAMGGGKTSAYTADINTADRARKQMRIKATQQKRHVPQLSSLIKSPIEMIELVSDTVELGPRYATYRALRNQGVEPQKAFYEACDVTVNFRRSGWMSRQINMVTPFFNANIQGIDKFVRFFTAANVPTNEKAKVLAGRAAFFVAQSSLMAAITIALNYRDKDKEKEYEQLSTFTKNNYWCIPADIANRFGLILKNGEFLALPKARELGILSSFIERCWEDRMRTDDHAWDEFAQYTSDNLLPAYLAELADGAIDKDKSVFEAMEEWPTNLGVFGVLAYAHANKDFLGRNIVSESLLNYEKKDQFTGKTSIPAYYIGQAFNLSPQKIDFVGQQVFSNVWKPMQALFPKDDFYKDKTLGVRNAWIKDSQHSNDLVNWMYDQADASEKKKNSDKENAEKVYRYSMDNKMKTFYGNYNSLTKEIDETADSRLYRQKVLDMISDYQESVENGVPQSQRAVYEVFKKYNDTSLLPTVMGTTIKDGSGAEYELNYKQYFNYQGSYNNNYYNLANDVFSVLTSPDDRALALKKIKGSSGKGFAQLMAMDEALIKMGKNPTGELDKYQDVDLRNVVIWQVYSTKADEAGVSVDDDGNVKNNGNIDQKEGRYALDQMDWLTPHEKAVLWNSKWDTVKNNPWKEYL